MIGRGQDTSRLSSTSSARMVVALLVLVAVFIGSPGGSEQFPTSLSEINTIHWAVLPRIRENRAGSSDFPCCTPVGVYNALLWECGRWGPCSPPPEEPSTRVLRQPALPVVPPPAPGAAHGGHRRRRRGPAPVRRGDAVGLPGRAGARELRLPPPGLWRELTRPFAG